MAYARAYADAARNAYRAALDAEVTGARNLGAGLIGLGTIAAGMAIFKAHRDALTGTALLGGSALAMGNWHFSKQRQLVYIAGIEATNCAVKAVAPFDLSAREQEQLVSSLNDLERRLGDATVSLARVNEEKNRLAATDPEAVTAAAAITTANTALSSAREVLTAGRKASANIRIAGAQLVVTVDRISAAVDKATVDTIPDLNSVKTAVGGLGALAGSFAPGAGLETKFASAFANFAQSRSEDTAGQATKAVTPMSTALAALSRDLQQVSNSVASVNGIITGIAGDAPTAALAECGVTITFALTATPAAVEFTAGSAGTQSVVLSGGTPPFTVRRQGADITGLTIAAPMAFDRTIHFVSASQLAGPSGSLLVMDASNPPKTVSIAITIKTASGGGTTQQPAAGSDPLVDKIKQVTTPFKVDNTNVTVTVSGVKLESGKVQVPVTCNPATPTLTHAKVADALLDITLASGGKVGAGAVGAREKLVFTGTCVGAAGGGGAQGRGDFGFASAARDETRAMQRSLCLPPSDVDGIHGPITQGALDRWRVRNKSPVVAGSPVSPAERRALLDPAEAAKCPA